MHTAEGEGGAARAQEVHRMEICQADGFWDFAIFEIEWSVEPSQLLQIAVLPYV
jgi:hypothetical protein